jgi:glycosyltransferase involved in cell wall biosynthesis/uncharacterized HAD superfamily protein/hypoxanthine phosphoribosyltransferase
MGKRTKMINYKTYSQLASDIRMVIKKIPKDLDLVVGNPRSGMIPAYMLGAFLNLPVSSLDEYLNDVATSNGKRPVISRKNKIKKVLVVDDTINSGTTLLKIKEKLLNKKPQADYLFFSVYATNESKNLVDFYASICEQPRIFQWNYLYHDILDQSCFDMDGVLCDDPTNEQNDDGDKYIDFILNAKPLYIPNYKIKAIVTSRLEKYRNQTEVWLKKNNVLYDSLYMLDLPTKEERIKNAAHGKFKAEVFKNLDDCNLFVESNRDQAIEIANLAQKPVICLSTDEIFSGSNMIDNQNFHNKLHTSGMPESGDYSIYNKLNIDEYEKREGSTLVSFISHTAGMAGAERSLLDLIDGLKKRGILSHVILPQKGPFEEELKKRSVPYDILYYRWWTCSDNEKKEIVDNEINSQVIPLISLLDKINPDIIYTNTSVINVGALAAKVLGKPHIWHIREFGELDHNLNFILPIQERSKFIYENSERVIFNSRAVKEYHSKNLNNGEVVYNNITLESSNNKFEEQKKIFKREKSYKLAVIGTLHDGKNQKDAVLATRDLLKKGIDTELVIVGEGNSDYINELKRIISENQLEDNVNFLGYIPKPYSVLREIDVLVVCSRSEAFGRVIIEGMLAKKPIIATRIGGITEIITDGVNGLLYTPGKYEDLVKKLEFIFNNKVSSEMYVENGYKFVAKHFSDDKYSGKIIKIFEMVGNFVATGLNSLYPKLWKTLNNKIKKSEDEIFNLIQSIQLKDADLITKNQYIQSKNEIIDENNKNLDLVRSELNSVKIQLDSKSNELNKIYSCRGWKTVLFARKLIEVFLPQGSYRRKISRLLYRAFVKSTRYLRSLSIFKTKNPFFFFLELARKYFFKFVPHRYRTFFLKIYRFRIRRPFTFKVSLEKIKKDKIRRKSFLVNKTNYNKKFAVYLNSGGNYFFKEIAENIAAGLKELGYEVIFGNESGFIDNVDWNLIVAPHEFFYIGEGKYLRTKIWPENTILFNTEQVSSKWFKLAYNLFERAYAIWDLNYDNYTKIKKEYFYSDFLPLGYSNEFDLLKEIKKLPDNHNTCFLQKDIVENSYPKNNLFDRPIDICFIGHLSSRREEFFSKNAGLFAKYNCYLYLSDVSMPAVPGQTTKMDSETVVGLIQRSKILLNIHHGSDIFFEWHRIVTHGISNRTLVVSEECGASPPFLRNIDYVSCSLGDMGKKLDYLLQNEDGKFEAQKIVDRAFLRLKNECQIAQYLEDLINNLKSY